MQSLRGGQIAFSISTAVSTDSNCASVSAKVVSTPPEGEQSRARSVLAAAEKS
ncbi:MAG TPA: hypothetical protein VGM06_19345 [Polyangiaceae bacterium]|jgi:hypothetical protein